MQCRTHVSQLGRLYPEFKAAGAEILVILGDTPERASHYAEQLKAPFPVLPDPDRAIYHRFDLEKAFILIQRTASVVVDRQGTIVYMKRATNPMLWLQESGELLAFVVSVVQARPGGAVVTVLLTLSYLAAGLLIARPLLRALPSVPSLVARNGRLHDVRQGMVVLASSTHLRLRAFGWRKRSGREGKRPGNEGERPGHEGRWQIPAH